MPTRILIYEDNADLRTSLSALISFSDNLELAGAYENCSDIANQVHILSPDILLMDIDMPVVDGIEGLKIVRQRYPLLPVIMMTVFEDNEHVINAIRNGATGYILKQHLTSKLGTAIEEAMNGGAPMSPVVASMVLKYISGHRNDKPSYNLTSREKDILRSLTDGNSYKMIAADLGISMGTVISHIKNVYEKLGVHSQAEAVSKTLRESII